jgi:hypothetical protein
LNTSTNVDGPFLKLLYSFYIDKMQKASMHFSKNVVILIKSIDMLIVLVCIHVCTYAYIYNFARDLYPLIWFRWECIYTEYFYGYTLSLLISIPWYCFISRDVVSIGMYIYSYIHLYGFDGNVYLLNQVNLINTWVAFWIPAKFKHISKRIGRNKNRTFK